tara:strand:- start:171 stop:1280 length:1110 start_codon:yes stop_codon:yes gene_type:complete
MILKHKKIHVLGTMSGTSFDGIDISTIITDGEEILEYGKNFYFKYPPQLITQLLKLTSSEFNIFKNKKLLKEISIKITKFYAKKILSLSDLKKISLIGFHGQTIYHNPIEKMSMQLGDAQLLSNLLNKPVIFDFRKKDLINGGQGAPLAPIYHKYILKELKTSLPSCLLNIGGISNITYVDKKHLIAFDTGPGNSLIDDLVKFYFKKNFDKNGEIAFSGKINIDLINILTQDPYLNLPYPKSLDRQYFNHYIDNLKKSQKAEDLISTITEFTSLTIKNSLKLLPKYPKIIIISGGGAKNKFLIERLEKHIKCSIEILNTANFHPDFIESQLIGFLSVRSLKKLPYTFPSTTGVLEPISGGKLFTPTRNH